MKKHIATEEAMTVHRYILERDVFEGEEVIRLMRIVMSQSEGLQGEVYWKGNWHPHPGALSYIPDPSPGDFIEEEQAIEVMKEIDLCASR